MNAPNWLLRGVIFGFIIGVTLTLLCGLVLAEPFMWYSDGCNTCTSDRVITSCTLLACPPESGQPSFSSCEKKMAEAMKLIAPFVTRPLIETEDPATRLAKELEAKGQFLAVMKECVK